MTQVVTEAHFFGSLESQAMGREAEGNRSTWNIVGARGFRRSAPGWVGFLAFTRGSVAEGGLFGDASWLGTGLF